MNKGDIWAIVLFMILLIAFILLLIVPLVSAYSWDEKVEICDAYNYTLGECSTFWEIVSNLSLVTVEYVNQTIYVNVTSNCSDDLSELEKIDEYAERGFEPVFENGIIVNFRKVTACEDQVPECEEYMAEKVAEIKDQYSLPVEQEPVNTSRNTIYFIIGLVVLVGGYFAYKKFKGSSGLPNFMPNFPSPSVKDKPSDNNEQPKKTSKDSFQF